MSVGRPDPLERLDATAAAVAGLRDIVAAEEPLDDVLDRVAASARHAIPNADAVTVTVLNAGKCWTAACTEARVLDLDREQYAAGRGPCLQAARSRRAVRAVVGERRHDWPEFADAADRAGIRAHLSVPLLLDLPDERGGQPEQETVGSLNVYSYTASAFDPFDESLIKVYSTAAEQAIRNARHWQHSRERISQLETALTSRAEIDEAKGILMAIHGCDANEAFAMLVEQSQHRNIKLNQLARDVVDSVRDRERRDPAG